jgi:hypothetical protein
VTKTRTWLTRLVAGVVGTAGILVGPGVGPAHAQCDLSYTASISDAREYEGTGPGTTNLVFTVEQTGCMTSVDYATANSSATQPGDYTQKSGTVTFQGFTATITVPVVRDSLDESNESFIVMLSNPKGPSAGISDGTGVGEILDDDSPPKINIDDASVGEGQPAGTTTDMNFKVSLSKVQTHDVTVLATTQNGSAVASQDYVALSNKLVTIPKGASFAWLTVKVKGENQCPLGSEPDTSSETFTVTLSSPVKGTLADGAATGTILDDFWFC